MHSDTFPALTIGANKFLPSGSFAETQAKFLQPDLVLVRELNALLEKTNTGVVAHFYMDAELQGVLSACKWPHIYVADSLAMAGRAVQMAQAGVQRVIVLGVDFMSENVRALLDASGFSAIPVFRVAAEEIGCSLAEAAESDAYAQYLNRAAKSLHALHVIYVNTSLLTKARAQATLPTITCTSSNVVRLILQATAQIPEIEIFFGPDTYMGANLARYFEQVATLDEAKIRALHPAHSKSSLRALLRKYDYFQEGNCIVHHMFDRAVVEKMKKNYGDAFVAAHLEVPGDMFEIGLNAQARGRGVVGSTSQILNFIENKVQDELIAQGKPSMQVVLGTESGMITSIAHAVQNKLRAADAKTKNDASVEVIFPVASDAINVRPDDSIPVAPGVASGEGCSLAGGCATCPYMKMNSLSALFRLLRLIESDSDSNEKLKLFFPQVSSETYAGRSVDELGRAPILEMRYFQEHGTLSPELEARVRSASTQANTDFS